MSYHIQFSGGIEPMIVSDASGAQLSELLEKKQAPEFLTANGRTVKTSRIISVEPQAQENTFNAKADARKLQNEEDEKAWRADWRTRHNMLPKERARVRRVVEMVWWCITESKEIPDELFEKITERSEKYFVEHPEVSYANPTCYKDLVDPFLKRKQVPRIEEKGHMLSVGSGLRVGGMALVERVLLRDMNFSRKVLKYGFDNVRL